MAINNRQKKFIEKNRKKLSASKMAKELNLSESEVQEFMNTFVDKPTPKIFYLIALMIPIFFFILLEVGLRIFDYGYNYEQWVKVDSERIGLNPDVARRYFYSTKSVPESIKDVFLEEKPANGFRVFVLGGSSAAGYPFMPNGSFSRYVRDRLQLLLPDKEIEVVNLSLTAVNSYTVRDFFDGVINYEPDVVLIYAGHNEYYGALGVGSQESLGQSPFFVNLVLSLNHFKTVQLIRDIISGIMSGGSKQASSEGTLMSRMAENQSIEYNSEIFEAGINQFRENISAVLEEATDNNISIIISTLASNLRDQKPFISKSTKSFPDANEIYTEAGNQFADGNYHSADSLYRYAKDLDLLRFRAPEKMNLTINELAERFNIYIVNSDSLLSSLSPNGIIGDNLMTDHLHPTLEGYFDIGKIFVDKMLTTGILNTNKSREIVEQSDSIARVNFHFTLLDSTLADFRIKVLKNDWPYINPANKTPINKLIPQKSKIDSLAFGVVAFNESWENAQRSLANWYLENGRFDLYKIQMDNLINQFPYFEKYYDMIAGELLQRKDYQSAFQYLEKRYSITSNDFTTKWLGIISLSKNNLNEAERYLLQSVSLNARDAQVLYNLAGVYVNKKNYAKALEYVNQCLAIDPNFAGAKTLQNQLKRVNK